MPTKNIIGIIGTAGRGEDYDKLDISKWEGMKAAVERIICHDICGFSTELFKRACLVSGGAAFADYITVNFYLRKLVNKLILHLPCDFVPDSNCPIFNPSDRTGQIANYYHQRFCNKLGKEEYASRKMILKAIKMGAKTTVSNGFFERNSLVARDSDYLIALTFGKGAKVKNGGTKDTVKKFIELKGNNNTFHVDLHTLEIFSPIKL